MTIYDPKGTRGTSYMTLQWALKFLPKLEAGLNEAQAARRGSLNSDTDEDSPPPEPDFD